MCVRVCQRVSEYQIYSFWKYTNGCFYLVLIIKWTDYDYNMYFIETIALSHLEQIEYARVWCTEEIWSEMSLNYSIERAFETVSKLLQIKHIV